MREMRTATVHLKSLSPYQQGRPFQSERKDKEPFEKYEERCWKERAHVKDGHVVIPIMAIKKAVEGAARYNGDTVPNKPGKATYTKHFEAGVLPLDKEIVLPIKLEDVEGEWIFVPSDGRRGGTTRVKKCFPTIPSWEGSVRFGVIDKTITEEIFRKYLDDAVFKGDKPVLLDADFEQVREDGE